MLSLAHFPHVADPLVRAALTHWFEIRRGNALPRRRDLDPCAIPAVLPFLALYQFLPEERTFLCRLAGDAIYGTLTKPSRGRRLAEFMSSHHLLEAPLLRAIATPAVLHGDGSFVFNGTWMDAETIMLPFADDGQTGDAVLHVMSRQVPSKDQHLPLAEYDLLSTTTPVLPDPATGEIVSVQRRKTEAARAVPAPASEEIPPTRRRPR
ncbi:MAG: hypothetical protein JWL84_1287 [Rhodospirillales bacterium]|nr:hypothetical protein [Rhodospirillales bacterium]